VELLANALELDGDARAQFVAAARAPTQAQVGTQEERDGARAATSGASLATLATLAAAPPAALVDRSDDLAIIRQLLTVEGARLLTLTGPAGVGKTRLALAAVAQLEDAFRDGVVFVDLTPIRDPTMVVKRLAAAIGLLDMGRRPLVDHLTEALRERRQLLVLDNFEQVLPAAVQLADVLAACLGLSLLVTSRVPLQLRWERTLRLAPLPVPDLTTPLPPLGVLLTVPSVELFVQRARYHQAAFVVGKKQGPLVARLTAQLDGLPLALELAAARIATLSLPALVTRLDDRLRLLRWDAPDMPERQQSLEAAVSWSYDLLGEEERRLFRCLGVFVGHVSLDAIAVTTSAVSHAMARVVTAGAGEEEGIEENGGATLDGLLSLAKQSLILPVRSSVVGWQREWAVADELEDEEDEEDLGVSFDMLETVRAYAEERLVAEGELAAARRAHAHYFLALVERADPLLRGGGQRQWYMRLEQEQDNLRAALRWLLDQDELEEREAGLRLAVTLGWFYWRRGYYAEGRRWLEESLAHASQGSDLGARSHALVALGVILTLQGDVAQARVALEEGLALAERRHDLAGIAGAYTSLGLHAIFTGEVAEATRLLHETLRRWEDMGDDYGLGLTHSYLGLIADATGDIEATTTHFMTALDHYSAAGDTQGAGIAHCYLGVAAWKRGDISSAVQQVRAGLRTGVTLRDRLLFSIAAQTAVALIGADVAPARRARLLGAADALAHATGASIPWDRAPGAQEMAELRERLLQGEGEESAAYQKGHALPFGTVARLTLQLLNEATLAHPSHEASQEQPLPRAAERTSLTVREREVLRLVAQGLSSKAIGQRLSLSPSTINQHVKAMFNKLGVDTRAQAVAVAAQRNLL
jgi:predicted ATPase/DNA-binding CsgD family transcriptional regulator